MTELKYGWNVVFTVDFYRQRFEKRLLETSL